ncbi:ATP-dependent DNA helicase [Leptolyngbya sp. 7M]|uniref:ATP-dependent DNA helicase n=1 Tax=Leptolyngbya sp. 7M TaxID=2812896 RepID=UPI001B8C87AE|nr:ATP-dependent DNA helicase [Leptolyngbya sp. 7M]QYO65639.1 ATP-dependent DNA helicase [Leptolyngbya sp. 7M]
MEKDIPFLKRILPTKFTAEYMKGRGNYACIYRVHKAENQPILDGLDQMDHFRTVADWMKETKTGDRAELVDLPENLSFWNRINARGDICIGQKCPDFEPCFITRMRDRADGADIVVVNHHLFFADLAVRGNKFGRVIPDYGAVIFDEAHLIEDVASDYFGFQVSNFQIDELARDTDSLPIFDAIVTRELTRIAAKIVGLAEQFWIRFSQARFDGRYPLSPDIFSMTSRNNGAEPTPLGEAHDALDKGLASLESALDVYAEKLPEAESLLRRTRQTRFDLDFIVTQTEKNYVYWLERRGRGIFLRASPVDVSELLREKLFDKVETCILTSATLSAAGSFSFVRERLGLDAANTDTFTAATAFDYEKQAVLYLPRSMPDPRTPEFSQLAAGEIVKVLEVTRGHAFVLCTSNSSMNTLFELVSSRVNYPCFIQGSMSKTGLLERFRETPNAVLFATASFWQGIDVQGEQLSCVIIDKLPFAVPSDPVVAARSRSIDENGGRSFTDYSVPQAVISLKQGIGRLIRSRSDRGVVAVLDPRLRTKPYGRTFLESLPRMRLTDDLRVVADVLGMNES